MREAEHLIVVETFTVDESTFRNAKLRNALLIAYKAFADLAGKGSLFVITVAAARRLSPAAFGVFSIGATLGWLVAVATDFGIQLHLARAVARRPSDAAVLLRTWLFIRLWMAGAAVAVVGVCTFASPWRDVYGPPVTVFAAMYAVASLIEFLHYFYRGLSRSDLESSLILWQRGGTLVCGLLALAWKPDVTVLAIAMLLPVVVTFVASLRIAMRLDGNVGRVLPPTREASADRRSLGEGGSDAADQAGPKDPPYISFHPGAAFFRDVFPIGAGIVLSALYFRIDVFLVQLWSGTESVALYNAVFRLVEALRLFPAAVLAVTLPSLVRARDLRTLVQVSWPVAGFAVVASGGLWLAAGWVIPLVYGDRYLGAVPAFRILLLSFPLLSLNYALTHQLIGWDGQRTYATLCGLALVVNVALNARLIPLWSIEGAAWATLATEAFLTVGCCAGIWLIGSRRSGAGVPGAEVQSAVQRAGVPSVEVQS
ncbi:MAG: oligosaccharide flippase family protein [Acidobacteria bacterium]|nr:oligosaccharide flippase family protein [Acidobacteriota bacterium]